MTPRIGRFRAVLLPEDAAGSMAAITCHRPHFGAPWDLLNRVSTRQRTALVIRYYLDLPEDDIAAIPHCRSKISEGTRLGLGCRCHGCCFIHSMTSVAAGAN